MTKEKYQLEYNLTSSIKILFNRLSTASGLNEWFADNVTVTDDIFTFEWDGTEQKAKVITSKPLKYIRFQWLEEEDEETYFEFKLETEALTKDIALIVTDFAEPDEVEDAKELWDSQIGELKHILGL